MTQRITFFRYVPLSFASDACRLGWMPLPGLVATHHGTYSVLMEWPCACPAPYPARYQ